MGTRKSRHEGWYRICYLDLSWTGLHWTGLDGNPNIVSPECTCTIRAWPDVTTRVSTLRGLVLASGGGAVRVEGHCDSCTWKP